MNALSPLGSTCPPPPSLDLGFNIFFSVEMLLRMMGLGALPPWGVGRYFQQPWNVFDAFMVREEGSGARGEEYF